jgi:hypothetical protein
VIVYTDKPELTVQSQLDGGRGFGMSFGGDTLVWSTCPQLVEGLQEKSVRNRHEAATAIFGYTLGTPAMETAWRPPDW